MVQIKKWRVDKRNPDLHISIDDETKCLGFLETVACWHCSKSLKVAYTFKTKKGELVCAGCYIRIDDDE